MITDNSPSCPSQGKLEFDEEKRASWFSHKGEIATPSYYKVYLAEHDVVTEMTPTERAVLFRFTFPENEHSYIVVDAFDKGSYVKVIPEENKIIGYTTRNSGGVPRISRTTSLSSSTNLSLTKALLQTKSWKKATWSRKPTIREPSLVSVPVKVKSCMPV